MQEEEKRKNSFFFSLKLNFRFCELLMDELNNLSYLPPPTHPLI